MSVVLLGSTSGSVTLSAPAVAGTVTVTLPSTSGTMATLTTPSFATTIGVGGATPAASGAGITFPVAVSASSDVNTLDDYEEGTWTPVLRGASTAGSYTLSEATASYVKIGRQVTVNCTIVVSAVSAAGVGYAQIAGLPFANSQQAQGPVFFANVNLDASCMWCVVEFISATGQAVVYFDTIRDNTSSLDTDISGFTTNSDLRFTLTYFAST